MGFTHNLISQYAVAHTLPRSRGSVHADWFTAKSLGDDHMKLFGSELLNMMRILQAFIIDVVVPREILHDHVISFNHLMSVIRLLQSGPSVAASRADELARLVERHHEAYIRAYGPDWLKPKWHQLLHVHEHGTSLGRILSCFVCYKEEAPNCQGLWHMGFRKVRTHCLAVHALQAGRGPRRREGIPDGIFGGP